MKRSLRIVLSGLLLLALAAVIAVVVVGYMIMHPGNPQHPVTVDVIRARMNAGAPLGADRATVEKWLASETEIEWEYRAYPPGEVVDPRLADSGVETAHIRGEISAIIRDTDRLPLVSGSITLLLVFDQSEKLVWSRADRWLTGL
jgi:hypothetical protein